MAVAAPLCAQSVPAHKVAASLERIFGSGAARDSIVLGAEVVHRVRQADGRLGYARVRHVMGKDQPITFLVATDSALTLRDVEVLVYREPYGGEVAQEVWRRQFRGKDATAPLRVGGDIRSISGATISVHAVTLGIRRTLAEFVAWRRAGLLP